MFGKLSATRIEQRSGNDLGQGKIFEALRAVNVGHIRSITVRIGSRGSGFAGLWAAISAREAGVERVAIVDKAAIAMSSQSRLCAGATIYCLPEDELEVWLRDIVEANGFLSRQPMVAQILESSYERLRKLEEWGVSYPKAPKGDGYLRIPSRGLEHVMMMVCPGFRDRVGGSAVIDALRRRAVRWDIQRHPRLFVTDLLRRGGRIAGALGLDRSTAQPIAFSARAVLLAGEARSRGRRPQAAPGVDPRGAAEYLREAGPVSPDADEVAALAARATAPLERGAAGATRPDELVDRMHGLIFRPEVSILKRGKHLGAALREIEDLRRDALPKLVARDAHELVKLHETRNMIQVAEMFLRASLTRTESRGSHFRDDHPVADDESWLAWINLRKSDQGEMLVEAEPVPLDAYPIQPRPQESKA